MLAGKPQRTTPLPLPPATPQQQHHHQQQHSHHTQPYASHSKEQGSSRPPSAFSGLLQQLLPATSSSGSGSSGAVAAAAPPPVDQPQAYHHYSAADMQSPQDRQPYSARSTLSASTGGGGGGGGVGSPTHRGVVRVDADAFDVSIQDHQDGGFVLVVTAQEVGPEEACGRWKLVVSQESYLLLQDAIGARSAQDFRHWVVDNVKVRRSGDSVQFFLGRARFEGCPTAAAVPTSDPTLRAAFRDLAITQAEADSSVALLASAVTRGFNRVAQLSDDIFRVREELQAAADVTASISERFSHATAITSDKLEELGRDQAIQIEELRKSVGELLEVQEARNRATLDDTRREFEGRIAKLTSEMRASQETSVQAIVEKVQAQISAWQSQVLGQVEGVQDTVAAHASNTRDSLTAMRHELTVLEARMKQELEHKASQHQQDLGALKATHHAEMQDIQAMLVDVQSAATEFKRTVAADGLNSKTKIATDLEVLRQELAAEKVAWKAAQDDLARQLEAVRAQYESTIPQMRESLASAKKQSVADALAKLRSMSTPGGAPAPIAAAPHPEPAAVHTPGRPAYALPATTPYNGMGSRGPGLTQSTLGGWA